MGDLGNAVQKVISRLKPPNAPYTGNLLWSPFETTGFDVLIRESLTQLRLRGYWASLFPEGDGITFYDESSPRTVEELVKDITDCFPWLDVRVEESHDVTPATRPAFPSLGYTATETIEKSQIALIQL